VWRWESIWLQSQQLINFDIGGGTRPPGSACGWASLRLEAGQGTNTEYEKELGLARPQGGACVIPTAASLFSTQASRACPLQPHSFLLRCCIEAFFSTRRFLPRYFVVLDFFRRDVIPATSCLPRWVTFQRPPATTDLRSLVALSLPIALFSSIARECSPPRESLVALRVSARKGVHGGVIGSRWAVLGSRFATTSGLKIIEKLLKRRGIGLELLRAHIGIYATRHNDTASYVLNERTYKRPLFTTAPRARTTAIAIEIAREAHLRLAGYNGLGRESSAGLEAHTRHG
jgi:hypothetical protein